MPQLTIGFATRNDRMAWMTLNAMRTYHAHLLDRIEILIIDNSPEGSAYAKDLEAHVRGVPGIRYLRAAGEASSCRWKDRVFQEARGTYVLQCDSHVLFEAGSIDALLRYYEQHPDSSDLIMGPCLNRAGNIIGTQQMLFADEARPDLRIPSDATVHQGVVCRGNQLGVWVIDPRGTNPAAPAYEIMQQGTGAFSCRRDAWPGFHASFAGFGGNEPYLMESFRDRGDKVLCLPALRWVHCFYRPEGAPYQVTWHDRIRNYLVGFTTIAARGGPRAAAAQQLLQATIDHFGDKNPQSTERARREAAAILDGKPLPQQQSSVEGSGGSGTVSLYRQCLRQLSVGPGGAIPESLFRQIEQHVAAATVKLGRTLRTLEYGAGASTLLFDALNTDHTCIEHKPEWVAKVTPLVKQQTTRVLHSPLVSAEDGAVWYDWQPPYGDLYDLILIDGPPGYNEQQPGRLGALGKVDKLLAPGGTIIIDDGQRAKERRLASSLAQRLGMQALQQAQGPRKWFVLVPPEQPLAGGPGTELVAMFDAAGFPKCQLCIALARRMDDWGIDGCREHMSEIVADMLPRAKAWLSAKRPWAQKLLGAVYAEEFILRREIEKNVNEAIATAERKSASSEAA